MNIVMFTNTFTPHVGGVARSVEAFSGEYRRRGHRVLVVAPQFEEQPERELDVVRIPAIQHFNGSDFSVVLPVPGLLTETMDAFGPDLVHSHHPFLLGNTAARVARFRELPLIFTHHTLYEQYTHYVPADSAALKRFVVALATSYANLCDLVFAPSESIAALLHERGVEAPIAVVPTGVNFERFSGGDGQRFRAAMGLPRGAFVVGHVGRLAPEKNLEFLTEAVATFLEGEPRAHFLVAGKGPSEAQIAAILARHNLSERLHHMGILGSEQLADAYAAMDVFAFASKSETQGMVLTEAMAAGTPIVGVDAAGVREVVRDGENGRLLLVETVEEFAGALRWMAALSRPDRERLQRACKQTGRAFSMDRCAGKALSQYAQLLSRYSYRHRDEGMWTRIADLIQAEWDILSGEARALGAVIAEHEPDRGTLP